MGRHQSISLVNNLKTVLLLGGLMGLCVAVGAVWGPRGMLAGLLIGGAINLFSWWCSDRIAIAAMRGRPLDERTGGDLYRMIGVLAERAELPMPRVYLSPHQAPNAFATGRSPKHAAVCFTQGAIDLLEPDELEGVAAHELAHVRNRDTLISTLAATVSGVLAFLAQMTFFFGFGRRDANPLVMIGTIVLASIGAAMIKAMISRSREFVADAEGAAIAGSPDGLISALRKLEAYSHRIPLVQPNPAQNNLFIIEPVAAGMRARQTLTNLFATHPPTERRIEALERLR